MAIETNPNPAPAPARPPRRRFRWFGYEVKVLLVVGLIVGGRLAWLWIAKGSSVPTVGPETTRVISPLRPDGTVDYLAAYNAHVAQGVTRENNAAIPLLRLFNSENNQDGFGNWSDSDVWAKILSGLGISPAPPAQRLRVQEFLQPTAGRYASTTTTPDPHGEPAEQYQQAHLAPWLPKDLPAVKKVVDANAAALDRVVKASRLPRYHVPRIPNTAEGSFNSLQLPDLQLLREASTLLAVRGLMHLGEGNTKQAADDFLACHRLARLIGQEPLLMCRHTALSLDSGAYRLDAALAHYGKLSREELADYLRRLRDLPPVTTQSTLGERYGLLDELTGWATGREKLAPLLNDVPSDDRRFVRAGAFISFAQTDELLRVGNEACDAWEEVRKLPTRAQRAREAERLIAAWRKRGEASTSAGTIAARIAVGTPRQLGHDLGNAIMAMSLPHMNALPGEEMWTKEQVFAELALQLAAHRAEHGKYPENLEALGPTALSAEQTAPFGASGPQYQRTAEGFALFQFGMDPDAELRDPEKTLLKMPIPKPVKR